MEGPSNAKFCDECGACRASAESKYCHNCGKRAAGALSPSKKEELDAALKQIKERRLKGINEKCSVSTQKKTKKKQAKDNEEPKKKTKIVQLGWKHFDPITGNYIQVKAERGGGTVRLKLPWTTNFEALQSALTSHFFPNGVNKVGELHMMEHNIGVYESTDDLSTIETSDGAKPFNLRRYVDTKNIYNLRFYLYTKFKDQSVTRKQNPRRVSFAPELEEIFDDSFDEDDFMSPFGKNDEHDVNSLEVSNKDALAGSFCSTSEFNTTFTQQKSDGNEIRINPVDQEESAKILYVDQVAQINEWENRNESARAKRRKSMENFPEQESSSEELTVPLKFRMPNGASVQRRFNRNYSVTVLLDFVGSQNGSTADFKVSSPRLGTIPHCKDKTLEDLSITSPETFDVVWCSYDERKELWEPLQSQSTGVQLDFTKEATNSSDEIVAASNWVPAFENTTQPPNIDQESLPSPLCHTQNELANASAIYVPSSSLSTDESIENSWKVRVHRSNVFNEMIETFSDPAIIEKFIVFTIVGASGAEELGQDAGGVYRDVISSFWRIFYTSACLGEERVPCLRHDFQERQWQACARILVKGFIDLKYWPAQLSRAFVCATLYGDNAVTDNCLLTSFKHYVDKDDSALISRLINESEEPDDDCIDSFQDMMSRYDGRKLVTKDNCHNLIKELAHKEIIQAPKYVCESWRPVLSTLIFDCPEFFDLQNYITFTGSHTPTTKKVLSILHANPKEDCERAVFAYLKKFIRGLNQPELRNFLKFISGSDMICFEEIKISFSKLHGLQRRPIASTCGISLDLPSTYDGYPEFRTEFRNILRKDDWPIDFC